MKTDQPAAAFAIECTPVPKPVGPRTKKAAGAWARYRAFKRHCQLIANGQFPAPIAGPVELSAAFYLPFPRSRSRAERRAAALGALLPVGKPDLKNLIAAVEDSLTGIAWKDDSAVVSYGFAYKRYAQSQPPRVCVLVRRLDDGLNGVHVTTHDRGVIAAITGKAAPSFPLCDNCQSNHQVEEVGPDTFGTEFHCRACGLSWAQSY